MTQQLLEYVTFIVVHQKERILRILHTPYLGGTLIVYSPA